MSFNWFKYSAPMNFYPLAGKLVPIFWLLALTLTGFGLYWGFFQTPDVLSEQKQYYRIIFVHVAASWMGMWLYAMMVFWGLVGLVFNTKLSFMMAKATSVTGAFMATIALVSGAVWGKVSWGTWWDWDPRLTMSLILLFLYIGYMALQSAIDDPRRADKASAVLALVGLAIVPVIYYSVNCPNPNECASLHQESSFKGVESNILLSMLVTALGFWMYSFAVILMRVRNVILAREINTKWVSELSDTNQ
ncbi:MAG: heme ABC transporter permease [Aquificaceae bacterium]|nr:MAG: heme ABC transporter permease [Aquificaceae bacterium]